MTTAIGGKGISSSEILVVILTYIIVALDGTTWVNIDPNVLVTLIAVGTGGTLAQRGYVKGATAKVEEAKVKIAGASS